MAQGLSLTKSPVLAVLRKAKHHRSKRISVWPNLPKRIMTPTLTILTILTALTAVWLIYCHRRKRNDHLALLAHAIATFRGYQERGLVHWRPRERQLLIEQSLASVYLTKREWWEAFMKITLLAVTDDRLSEAYEKATITAEAAAVRKAKAEMKERGITQPLTKADIYRIRQQARDNMQQIDLQPIEEFDIFIIRATATSVHTAEESTGELIAVGHYHIGGQTEMALFDDIKHHIYDDK